MKRIGFFIAILSSLIFCNKAFMSGQHFKDISLEKMVQDSPVILEAVYLSVDTKNSMTKHFRVSRILRGDEKGSHLIGKEIVVNRAGAWEWSLTLNRADQTGESVWTQVNEYNPKTEIKLESGTSYFLFLTSTVSGQFDFFANNGYLPLSASSELENLFKRKKRGK